MLNEDEIKKIINRTGTVEDGYKLELIQQHIFDVKNVQVTINPPLDSINYMLMHQAFSKSLLYFKNKFNERSN